MLEIMFRDFTDEDQDSFISAMSWDGKERMDSRKYKIVLSELLFLARHSNSDYVCLAADIYQDYDYIDTIYCFSDKYSTRGVFRIMADGQYIRIGDLY